MSEPSWLILARSFLGLAEIKGTKHNPVILKWWQLIGAKLFTDEDPWCAGFVGGVLEACGIKSSKNAMARSYMKWGTVLAQPVVGCVVIFSRPPNPASGHVGFVVGRNAKGNLMVLGGNQGDKVSIAAFDTARVVGYRWPSSHPIPFYAPLPVLTSDGKLSTNEA